MAFNFENLQLPPPPPPPKQQLTPAKGGPKKQGQLPRKSLEGDDTIDMDLSDDDNIHHQESAAAAAATATVTDVVVVEETITVNDNLKVVTLIDDEKSVMEPPPPFPEFNDEADANANNLLDDLNNDLDESDDLLSALGGEDQPLQQIQEIDDDILDSPRIFEGNNPPVPIWNNNRMIVQDMPPPMMPLNGPMQNNMRHNGPPDLILGPPWPMQQEFHHEFRGRGNKRGNFNNGRGDFRGRPHGRGGGGGFNNNWRGRSSGGGNYRGGGNRGMQRGGSQGGMRMRPPFYRGRFRGGY